MWPRSGGFFDYDEKKERLEEVDLRLEDPELWNNPEAAQALGQERTRLEQVVSGLDDLGRDMSSLIFYGARLSVRVGVFAVGLAILVGATLGAIAGYAGGTVDNIIMRAMDIMLSFPSILLALVIVVANRPLIPCVSCVTTLLFLSIMAGTSMDTLPVFIPWAERWL